MASYRLSIEPSVSHIIAVQVQCKGSQSGREPKHGDQIGLQGGIRIRRDAKSVPPQTSNIFANEPYLFLVRILLQACSEYEQKIGT